MPRRTDGRTGPVAGHAERYLQFRLVEIDDVDVDLPARRRRRQAVEHVHRALDGGEQVLCEAADRQWQRAHNGEDQPSHQEERDPKHEGRS